MSWLAARAAATPEALALEEGARRVSWRELEALARAAAARLSAAGVRAGARVALWLPPGVEFVCALHAVWRLGAVAVPVNLRLPEAQVWLQLAPLAPLAVLRADANTPERFDEVAPEEARALAAKVTPSLAHLRGTRATLPAPASAPSLAHSRPAPAAPRDAFAAHADDAALALILFTSGTTGAPKAACLRFANLAASARASAQALRTDARDRWLLCLPLFHIGGLSILVRAVFDGAAVVLHADFDAARVAHALDAEGITRVSLVPTTLARVLDARGPRPAPQTLRSVLLGGAACPASLLARALHAGFPLCAVYGATETASQIASVELARDTADTSDATRSSDVASAPDAAFALDTAQAPDAPRASDASRATDAEPARDASPPQPAPYLYALPGNSVRVVGADGEELPTAREGEIQVRGPSVFAGYWNDAPATRAAFAGDWLRMGDCGVLDARGALRVLGRRDEVIISGGENVHPAQVEAVLLEHALVAEAAVWRLPDADLGQRVAAWVVARAGARADTEALLAHCRARLAGPARPRAVFWVDALPRGALGKVQRRLLHARR